MKNNLTITFYQRGCFSANTTFFITMGWAIMICITIDMSTIEKLIVKACDLEFTIEVKKKAMNMYD